MSELFTQQFATVQRTIRGLDNVVFNDDFVINCDTSSGAVSLTLPSIPVGNWSATYKLMVGDSGNNALVNNITINAPSGFTVNGQTSITILANKAAYAIEIGNDTNYVAYYSGNIANVTTNGLISVTNAQLISIINGNSLIKGQFYLVTDAGVSGGVPIAGQPDAGVVVQGVIINNAVVGLSTVTGSGLFYNANYDSATSIAGNPVITIGITPAFNSWRGIWTPSIASVSLGDVVIWNNYHYVCQLAFVSPIATTPNNDSTHWKLLTSDGTTNGLKQLDMGYLLEVDVVKYDYVTNLITYRADKRGNEVDNYTSGTNSLSAFQWGRSSVANNKLYGSSYMKCTNSYAHYNGNVLDNSILTQDVTNSTSTTVNTVISNNKLSNSSSLIILYGDTFLCTGNTINLGASVTVTTADNSGGTVGLRNCLFSQVTTNFGAGVTDTSINDNRTNVNKVCMSGLSTFEQVLTVDTKTANLLDIIDASNQKHVGIYLLKSATSIDFWDRIQTLSTLFPTTFKGDIDSSVGQTFGFKTTAVSGVASDYIVSSVTPYSIILLTTYSNGDDFIVMQRAGHVNQIMLTGIMQ
jgi:hypothetical protein